MSFSAEMKDFINAYKTGQTINASRTDQDYKDAQRDALEKKTARENDPEQLEFENQKQQLQLKALRAGLGSSSVRDRYYEALIKSMQGGGPNSLLPPPAPGAPAAPKGAVPTAPVLPPVGTSGGNLGDTSQIAPEDASPLEPLTASAATGGLIPSKPVRAYQGGGAVPDDDEAEGGEEEEPPPPQGVLPTELPPAVAGAQARMPSPPKLGIDGVVSPQLLNDAVLAGQSYGAHRYGLTQAGALRAPSQRMLAQAYVQGHSGLSPEELEAAKNAVDPKHELNDSQRNMAALGSVWQFWNNKGEGEKAGRVAFQMLQHFRNASQRYAAIAAHANAQGNMPLAAQAMVRAYQNVPDGRDLSVEVNPDGGYFIHETGPNGEDIAKELITPQQMGAAATGLASGGFDKALLHAAGVQEQAAKPGKGAGGPKPSDRIAMEKLVTDHANSFVDELNTKSAKEGKTDAEKEQLAPQYKLELNSAAQRLLQHNPDMTGPEAVSAAHQLLQPGAKDPEKMDFKVTGPSEDNPYATVDFGGKMQAKVPPSLLDNFANQRAARIKSRTDEINARMEAEDKPTMGGAIKDVGGAVWDALPRVFGRDIEDIKAAYQWLAPRAKAAFEQDLRTGDALGAGMKAMAGALGEGVTELGQRTRGAMQGALPIVPHELHPAHPPVEPDSDIPNVAGRGALPIDPYSSGAVLP